jgi:hypothetical protein
MLVTLAAAGVFLLKARHTYPTDVATAAAWRPASASEEAAASSGPASAEDPATPNA